MKGQICHLCGQPRAGGGQRFCWGCLGLILSKRGPNPSTPAGSGYVYPKPKANKKKPQPPRPA
jgi:hypothetical protein